MSEFERLSGFDDRQTDRRTFAILESLSRLKRFYKKLDFWAKYRYIKAFYSNPVFWGKQRIDVLHSFLFVTIKLMLSKVFCLLIVTHRRFTLSME